MTTRQPFSTSAPFAPPRPSLAPQIPLHVSVDLGEQDVPDNPEPAGTSRRRIRIALLALALALLSAAVLWVVTRDETPAASPDDVAAAIDDAFSSTTLPAPVGPAIYNALIPSLVFIQNGEIGDANSSIGSGVIINSNGNIMTSHHVVEGAASIRVTFADGTATDATIAQANPEIDIAVLEPAQLPEVVVPAVLGGGVRVGDDVFALGNPLGLGGSFSAGVVSGLDRTLPLPDGSELGQLIQFDAAVNPGSSGGPLLDRSGQVVGIVTALANPTGEDFFSGIGFAVPIATAGGAAGGPDQ